MEKNGNPNVVEVLDDKLVVGIERKLRDTYIASLQQTKQVERRPFNKDGMIPARIS